MNPFEPGNNSNSGPYDASDAYRSPPSSSNNHQQHPRPNGSGQRSSPPQGPPPPFSSAAGSYSDGRGGSFSQYAQHPGSSMGQQQQQPQRPQQPPQRQSNPGVSFQMPDRITPQRSALSTDSVQKSDPFGGKNRSNDVNSGLPELRKDFANHLDPEGQQHGGFSGSDFKRKKSLVRPDRERMDPNHRQWYYRNHAAQLESADAAGRPAHHVGFMPSTTGHMPQHGAALPGYGVNHLQGPGGGVSGLGMISADVGQQQQRATNLPPGGLGRAAPLRRGKSILGREEDQVESGINFLKRGVSLRRSKSQPRKSELPRDWAQPEKPSRMSGIAPGPVGPWMIYCYILTICCPGPCLGLFGIKTPEQQRAWREKMGLISIILTAMGAVGFITFGFTQAVCDTSTTRYEAGKIDNGSMIFHGYDFDFNTWVHPQVGPFVAGGAWSALNPVYSDPFSSGKTDGSMMMQRGGGACSGLLKNADGTDATQFYPCQITYPTGGVRYRNSTMCHATTVADAMLDRTSSVPLQGPIYYSWDQITNTSANYLVWKGSVIDLNRLTSIYANITVPAIFSSLKTRNESWAGKDVTATVFRAQMDTTFDCLDRIARVGFVDSDSIGCVASKVELYVALVFILGVVGIKFFMAVIFGWFLSHRLGNFDNESRKQRQKRANEIEEWSDNIYRPAPAAYRPNARKSRMFLPNTSRFSTAAVLSKNIPRGAFSEKSGSASGTRSPANRLTKIGLSSPSGGSPPGSPSLQGARSSASLVNSGTNGERSMSTYGALTANAGSRRSSISHDPQFGAMGSCPFPLDHVIPQPPSDYQPFHFPLVQSICLVTAYSESFEGLRTTLDSLATTDYPNSHKVILVIADGIVKGAGSDLSTPDICLSMMKDFITPPEEIEGHSYVAIADGHKRHNMAKVYAGFYEYDDETVERSKQQRIPMVLVAKCGSPLEADGAKPGNRGKRDSQVLLMAFLQKVMFDERMTVFEYEFFNSLWRVTGVSPDHYEIILMVDADTKVFPDSLTRMVACMVEDPDIMGLCGETKIANKSETWVTMIQVFEYYISHHQTKAFEACFGGVTCLPGCFSAYRIKAPKGGAGYWVPILANPDIVEHYSENVVDTLHKKNLLLLGEDRFLTTLMLKTFPKRKMMFVPAAVCKTIVPDTFRILLSQRRRWINSTVHNLSELVMVNDLCGTFCFSMRFVIFMELAGTLVLPAAIAFTLYVVVSAIVDAIENKPVEPLPLILLALILGLPGVLIIVTSRKIAYVGWMGIYLVSLPIWNFIFPVYAFWHMDDFSWGATRIIQGDVKGDHGDPDGKFDPSNITMKRWIEFERERKLAAGLQSRDSTYDVLHIGSPDRMGSRHSMVSGSVAGHSDAPSHLQTDRLLSSLGSHMEASESSHGMRGANPGARARMDAVPLLSLPAPLGDASAAKAVGGPNAAGSIQVARPMREASPSSYSGSRAPYDPFPVEEEKQPMMRGDTTSVASSPDPIFANRSHFGSNGAEFANTLSSEPDEFGMSSHGGHVPALPPSIMGGANAARPPREVGAPRQSMSSQTGSVGMMPPRPQHSMQSHQSGPPPSSSSHASHGRGVSLVDDGPVAGSAGPRVVQRGARRQSSIQDGGSSQQQQNNGARFSRSQQDHAASTNGGHSSNATHASTNPFNRQ